MKNNNMKKIITLITLLILTVSCMEAKPQPIEKFGGSKYVVADKYSDLNNEYINLKLKNRDTIFWVTVLNFDGEKIEIGDTIK
jgi:hypothetical protein